MKAAFPMVTKQLTESFSNAAVFLEKGMVLRVINRESTALIDQVCTSDPMHATSFKTFAHSLLDKMSKISKCQCIGYTMILKLKEEYTVNSSQLQFSVSEPYAENGYSLKGFQEKAASLP